MLISKISTTEISRVQQNLDNGQVAYTSSPAYYITSVSAAASDRTLLVGSFIGTRDSIQLRVLKVGWVTGRAGWIVVFIGWAIFEILAYAT